MPQKTQLNTEWEFLPDPSHDDQWEFVDEKPPEYKGPTTFGGGFKQSLTSGEALNTGLRGLQGFAQGAIADIPESMFGALKNIAGLIQDPVPTMLQMGRDVRNLPGQIAKTTSQAGSNPEAFGEMMGQVTGQPLVTAGMAKAAPYVPKAVGTLGRPLEVIGGVVKREGLASGVMPPITTPRYLKLAERQIGRGIENIGQRIQVSKLTQVPKGTTIVVGAKQLNETKIQMIIDKGFKFKGTNATGDFRFEKY